MGKNNIVAGLEISRLKLRMAVGQFESGKLNFLGSSEIASFDCVKNGMIINLDGVTEAIVNLVEAVGQRTDKKIDSVFVNISGPNIRQEVVNSVITLPQRGAEVTKRNIDDLIGSCKIVSVPLDRHLLHLLPIEYIIDGQDGIKEPIGLCGNRVEAKVLIITAPFNQVQNIIKGVNSAGLEMEEVVLTALANANSLLDLEEKREGVLLIDFKTDLTEVSVFKGGVLTFFEAISKGQGDITTEIASNFKIPLELAEELKIRYGFIDDCQQDVRNQEAIPLEWMGVRQTILRGDINRIIATQDILLFDLLLERLRALRNFNNVIKRGAVLNGGRASMEGFLEWAAKRLGFSVRAGIVKQDTGSLSDSFITSSGLVRFGLDKKMSGRLKGEGGFFKRVYQKADELLTEYF